MYQFFHRLLLRLGTFLFRVVLREPLRLLRIPLSFFFTFYILLPTCTVLTSLPFLFLIVVFYVLNKGYLPSWQEIRPDTHLMFDSWDPDSLYTTTLYICFFYSFFYLVPNLSKRIPKAHLKRLSSGLSSRRKPLPSFLFETQDARKHLSVTHPFQGIYLEGGAGAGKSQSVIEPFLYQAVRQGYAGFLYDFKGNPPTLSSYLHGAFSSSHVRTQFTHINLSDPTISHRCNPLSPAYFPHKHYAHEYASVVLKNLHKSWAQKTDFWAENAIAYLAAILWYLRKHHPQHCTLPHATLLAMEPATQSLSLLRGDAETERMISAIITAQEHGAEKQLAGIFSSLQISLSKLYTREIFWLFSAHPGDEGHVSLDVSDPSHPQFLSVANNPALSEVCSPLISLIALVCMKHMNQQHKHKAVFLLDEAPTLFIPDLAQLPATARANKVVSVVGVQDFAQLQHMYGTKAAETLRNNLGNQFFGMTNNLDTAEYVSKMAGFYQQEKTTVGDSFGPQGHTSSDTSSLHKEAYVDPHQVTTQPPGHFIVKTTGVTPRFFSAHLKRKEIDPKPPVQLISRERIGALINDTWRNIHQDVKKLLSSV